VASEATGYSPLVASRARQADNCTDAELAREELEHVEDAVVGLLDPVDEPDYEQHGDGIV
jgi:hypothetical protein